MTLILPGGTPLTDLGLAEELVRRAGADLRHVRPWKTWVWWTAQRWVRDRTGEAERRAKEMLRGLVVDVNELTDEKTRAALIHALLGFGTAPHVKGILDLASTEDGVAALPEVFDAHREMLNTPTGTLDLQTGDCRAHNRDDYLTALTGVAYEPGAVCPRWDRFITDVTSQQPDLAAYLQRVAGYMLTGHTGEQVWFFAYGPGGNGKTTFVEVLRGVLGDYARRANFGTFLAHRGASDEKREDIARLAGARLVTATEPGEDDRFNASLLKDLTGGDRITARHLYQGSSEFTPHLKLLLVGNHKPECWDTSEGFWRRVKLLPFTYTVPPQHRVKDYHTVLLAEEGPGILAWMVNGCVAWQRHGLATPEIVERATHTYRDEQDIVGRFLTDCTAPGDTVEGKTLYAAYESWCTTTGDNVLGIRTFNAKLRERGMADFRSNGTRGWKGIRLVPVTSAATAKPSRETGNEPPF